MLGACVRALSPHQRRVDNELDKQIPYIVRTLKQVCKIRCAHALVLIAQIYAENCTFSCCIFFHRNEYSERINTVYVRILIVFWTVSKWQKWQYIKYMIFINSIKFKKIVDLSTKISNAIGWRAVFKWFALRNLLRKFVFAIMKSQINENVIQKWFCFVQIKNKMSEQASKCIKMVAYIWTRTYFDSICPISRLLLRRNFGMPKYFETTAIICGLHGNNNKFAESSFV